MKSSGRIWVNSTIPNKVPRSVVECLVHSTDMETDCNMASILPHNQTLQWRHNGHDGVPNHQLHDCLLNRLFRRRSNKTSKLRVTGLCEGNSPGTGEFPAQRASDAENVSIWWRHHEISKSCIKRSFQSSGWWRDIRCEYIFTCVCGWLSKTEEIYTPFAFCRGY